MLSKAAKNEIVEQFSEVFKANPSVVLVEYKGLTVGELEGLRTNLKDADTELTVVKNTLLKIAAKDTNVEQLSDMLTGPTAIAVCENDPTAAAKVFVDTAKDLPSLVIKGGIVEGSVVGAEEITAISKLPSRQEMMAQLLGALSSPMSGLLGALTQMQTKLLYALEAVKDQKDQDGGDAASEAKPEEAEEAKVETKEEAKEEKKEETKAEAKEEPEPEKEEAKAEEKVEEAKAEEKSEEEPAAEAKEENEEEPKEEVKAESAEESEPESEEASEEEGSEETEDKKEEE